MKLYYSPTSPFVRKVVIAAKEIGVFDRIDIITDRPFDEDSTVKTRNPLGKVPALITDDGVTLFDSHVICLYIDSLGGAQRLFPSDRQYWTAHRFHALADGIMEATLLRHLESGRPNSQQSPGWIARQEAAIERTLGVLEAEAHMLDGTFDIGAIGVVCALGYLDLRYRALPWRGDHPRLASWMADCATRDSVSSTAPPRVRSKTLRGSR